MKIILLLFVCVLCSCVSRQNLANVPQDYSKIATGKNYFVIDKNGRAQKIKITSIDDDSIMGTRDGETITVQKSEILAVKKPNTGLILAIVGVSTALTVVGTVIIVNGLQKVATGVGAVLGGIH